MIDHNCLFTQWSNTYMTTRIELAIRNIFFILVKLRGTLVINSDWIERNAKQFCCSTLIAIRLIIYSCTNFP